eukprot:16227-Eustigmatos_ZCMA.PRE.1
MTCHHACTCTSDQVDQVYLQVGMRRTVDNSAMSRNDRTVLLAARHMPAVPRRLTDTQVEANGDETPLMSYDLRNVELGPQVQYCTTAVKVSDFLTAHFRLRALWLYALAGCLQV